MPAGKPDSGLERSGLQGFVERRHRSAPCDEQFPRVHRLALPGSVRGFLRSHDQRFPGDDQGDRKIHHRTRFRAGLGEGDSTRGPHGQESRRRGFGPCGSGRRPATQLGGTLCDRVRARRQARRAHALRNTGFQDGQDLYRPAHPADGRRGRGVPRERERRRRPQDVRITGRIRRHRAGRRRPAAQGFTDSGP